MTKNKGKNKLRDPLITKKNSIKWAFIERDFTMIVFMNDSSVQSAFQGHSEIGESNLNNRPRDHPLAWEFIRPSSTI